MRGDEGALLLVHAAIDQALAEPQGPVVMADGADNPGGGAAGDSTFVLRRLLERGVQGPAAQTVISACLVSLAVSIALHGVSATPLMNWYQRRRAPAKAP